MQTLSRNLFRPKNTSKSASRKAARRGFRARLEALEARELLSATEWSPLGPAPIANGQTAGTNALPVSGRISGVAVDQTDPTGNTIYIAAAGGGVWKTTDGGTNWAPLTDHVNDAAGNPVVMFMGSIAVAPNNKNIIYAGTGEANNGADDYYGEGVLKSTNGGTTWTLVGQNNFTGAAIDKVVVDPNDPNTVYVAVGSDPENGNGKAVGIWKSTDGGTTWTNTTNGQIATADAGGLRSDYSDLVMDPTNSKELFAAVGFQGFQGKGSTLNGVYETINGGATWTPVGGGLKNGATVGRISLAAAPSNSNVYYASFSTPTDVNGDSELDSVWTTTNNGTTWTNVSGNATTLAPFSGQGWYDTTLAVSPTNANVVYLAGGAGPVDPKLGENHEENAVIATTAGGNTWTAIGIDANGNGPHADHHAFAFDPQGRLLDGDDGGLFRYTPTPNPTAGTWASLNGTPATQALNITQFYSVAVSATNPNVILGGSQDNGTSRYSGNLAWTLTDGGDGGTVAFSPTDAAGQLAYHVLPVASSKNFFKVSDNAGQTWTTATTGLPADFGKTANFNAPLVVSPTNGNEVIIGNANLWITTNAGTQWAQLTTVGKNGWNPKGNPVDSIAISPSNPNWIYASTGGQFANTSQIFVSTDGGQTWKEIDLAAGTGHVSQLAVDPNNDQLAYAVVNQFGGGHVFVTANGGANWTNISGNLPNVPTFSIALNTDVRAGGVDVLYVGTDTGVYTSLDGGAHWAPMATGLPNVQVDSLDYSSRFHVLVAGTHGRGAWEIMTLSPFLAGVPGDGTPQTFVHNLYRELLGREPDAGGEAAWAAYLAANNNAVGQYLVVQDFMNSAEYKAHYVTVVYQIFLDRTPDAAGLQFWTDKMGNPGTPGLNGGSADEKYIVAAIMGSDEFYVKAGNTPQAWINAVYQDIFNRAVEPGGLTFWMNELLIRGLGDRDGIVRDLLTSPEAAHDLLDAFYPLPGGAAGTALAAPGTTAGTNETRLALLTGGGWENLYLEGPYGPFPEAYDGFWASLAGGGNWDDIQLLLLSTPQAYNNPNRPITQ